MTLRKRFQIFDPLAKESETLTGLVSDFQRFSIHDGPGIRTIVFFKGCPLHCLWCQNPENIGFQPELLYIDNNCIQCHNCVAACPNHCISIVEGQGIAIDKVRCSLSECGKCQHMCYANAINIGGRYLTVSEVMDEVDLDREFYDRSGGGVTFSGGEPFSQPRFLEALALEAKERGLRTAVETCGQARWDIMQPILRHMDLVLYDVKHMDPETHQRLTGVTNGRILENLLKIDAMGIPLRIRLPLIPGLNDTPENLQETVSFAAQLSNLVALDVLPYHRMGEPKWSQLGQDYPLHGLVPHTKDQVLQLVEAMKICPVPITIGG